jgi:hypothetical protein
MKENIELSIVTDAHIMRKDKARKRKRKMNNATKTMTKNLKKYGINYVVKGDKI